MDRLSQLRGEAGSSRDSTLDSSYPLSEAFMTANESSSKFYSLSEVDSTLDFSSMKDDISSIKDVSLATTAVEAEGTMTNAEELISNLSPIGKKNDILDSYKIDTQIEAANILSGGVAIFDDNSYDGNELVIDDNVEVDEKSNPDLKQTESLQFKPDENIESDLISEETDIASKDTEVLLQIDGKNVDAIDIGNGLYLYRKEGQEELAAVQIIDDDQQQPSFKFLKVRENAEGNLEVYEEIEVEVPKEVPAKEGKTVVRNTSSHVPIRDINKVISESNCNRAADKQVKPPKKEPIVNTVVETENKEVFPENKSEVNFNGKMMKLSESRKSPVIGSFTPMTYHSTPKKEGIPLTKTMVDQQLHPNRHSDISNVKKTIEVHTDSGKKTLETSSKCKDIDDTKLNEIFPTEKEIITTDKEIITTDKDVSTTDKEVITTNETVMTTDKEVINTNETVMTTDTEVIAINKEVITMDKADIMDKAVITADKEVITVGKEIITMYKEVITMDEEVMIMDKKVITMDKEIITTDKEVITMDKEVIPTVKEVITTDKEVNTMDKDVITLNEEVIPMDKDVITTDKEFIINTDKDATDIGAITTDKGVVATDKEVINREPCNISIKVDEEKVEKKENMKNSCDVISEISKVSEEGLDDKITKDEPEQDKDIPTGHEISIDSTKNKVANINIDDNPQLNANLEVETAEDNIKLFEKSVHDTSEDVNVNTDKSTKIDDNTGLFSLKTGLSACESKPIYEDNTQIEQKATEKEKEKLENTKMDVIEPILIEDDDVSIVEIVVENKHDENKHESEAQITEDNLKIRNTIAISNTDTIIPKEVVNISEVIINKEAISSESTVTNSGIHPEPKNKQLTSSIQEQELKKPAILIEQDTMVLHTPKRTLNEDNPVEIVNKDVAKQKNENVLAKTTINDSKQITLLPNVADDIQNNKSIESLGRENSAPKDGTAKHILSANISPLLEQKQQSLVTSRVVALKSTLPEKNEAKLPSPCINDIVTVNKFVEQNVENKLFDAHSKNVPIKPIQVTRPMPVVAQMQVYSSNAPQGLIKNKPVKVINNETEFRKNTIPLPIKNITADKPKPVHEFKPSFTNQRIDKNDVKVPQKVNTREKASCVMNIEISKVPKADTVKSNTSVKQTEHSAAANKLLSQELKYKLETKDKKDNPKIAETKPINNNHTAVPFGKWTEANKQEFLNKFKIKASVTSSNSNQLKNSNDLNRRDILKKIDSQRQSSTALSKSQEANKHNMKSEMSAFSNKPNIIIKESTQGTKIIQKADVIEVKSKTVVPANVTKIDVVPKYQNEPQPITVSASSKKEICQTKEKVQNLIDKTIEGMIHRNTIISKSPNEPKPSATKEPSAPRPADPQKNFQLIQQPPCDAKLDEIEMKMNELHGIPFIERPAHELPQVHKAESKSHSIIEKEKPAVPVKTKIPNLLPFSNKTQQKVTKEGVIEVDSEDEIIEHEPITGDIDLNKKKQIVKPLTKAKVAIHQEKPTLEASKSEPIITEKDFDKFARRNSITCENYLTVNFDNKEPHNVVQTVVEKEPNPKTFSRNATDLATHKTKVPYKQQSVRPNTEVAKQQAVSKLASVADDASNRNQSKLQKAYYSALTEKRQTLTEKRQKGSDFPITILEDKPVKVLFMNKNEYAPTQLNVQGQDLSPVKRAIPEPDAVASTSSSPDTNVLDPTDDVQSQDNVRTKIKHQRKQVLTPVEEPELELIEPQDLDIDASTKKKRRIDDDKTDKNLKYPMRKKYLLSSSAIMEDKVTSPIETMKNPIKESVNLNDNGIAHSSPVSALDSLVKAAELIETQTENMNNSLTSNSDSQSNTPAKRGRGRPRKYPLTPDGTVDKSKVTTPIAQKKQRLIDAVTAKRDISSDDSDSEGEIIRENWTMGKINENIVCPICNKLFRTENVVFKHVKHCTGPSPNRSDSDKRSPRRMRLSQDSDGKSQGSKSDDMDIDDDKPLITQKLTSKKRKSKDSRTKSIDKDDVIVIEDTPIKEKPEKSEERKTHVSRKSMSQIPLKNNNLVCEFCGKTFRQLSYLVSHKLQHKKQEKSEPSKTEKSATNTDKSVYSCEVCKKEFRKLHHLVQHRIIHNQNSVQARMSRKSSMEQAESKIDKEPNTAKQNDDPSAGFRCEPCDKSFRKLHHLVEHRETHDGINRQKTSTALPNKEEKTVEKPIVLHQCDICKKTFKKLIHLNEHKEQHVETSSEKSDDKSVKSSLSTKDIIHECSLCYMVFPNEHSLNKHTIICQRKKRQSKQIKPADDAESSDDVIECLTPEEKIENAESPNVEISELEKDEEIQEVVEKVEVTKTKPVEEDSLDVFKENPIQIVKTEEPENLSPKPEVKLPEAHVPPAKRNFVEVEPSNREVTPEVPEKIKKAEHKEPAKIQETPKRKTLKDKTMSATKRLKTTAASTSVTEEVKPTVESSDDDEIRYMLNPNFKVEDVTEEKVFMKVRAKKRSSLQIERPDSKDLMKRRTSLQHPPKIPRLKAKPVENNVAVKKELKISKEEPLASTDSDDSEATKYAFPSTIPEKSTKPAQNRTPKDSERKTPKKSVVDKRKSLSGIAKRKSLGKAVTARHKLAPLKPVKKRTLDAEHRCDCGQLFSSAALLSRHTSLAHTPPRVRRRRSPPPDDKPANDKPATKASRKSAPDNHKQVAPSRKSYGRSVSSASNAKSTKNEPPKKSLEKSTKTSSDAKKTIVEKPEEGSRGKPRRTAAHRGVPVPDKMKKLLGKNK